MKKLTNFAAILMVSTMLQSQTKIFVKPDGIGNGTTWANSCNLETAVKTAVFGDQIWVQFGTHYPSKMLVVPASVKIYGGFVGTETTLSQRNFSANPTVIDGQNKIGSIFRLGKSVELNGMTIQNGNANGNPHKNGGGVWAEENCVIENCIITHNSAMLNGGGIYANGKVKIINTTIKDNTSIGSGNDMFGNCMMVITNQTAFALNTIVGCDAGIPGFGEISFKSDKIWKITNNVNNIHQEWSDIVMATGCNKTNYDGGMAGSYYSDCRANSNRTVFGDLFSWCAVTRFAHVLCPSPWRVPTSQDFCNLDIAMGGTGENRNTGAITMLSQYVGSGDNQWGGAYGGACQQDGSTYAQGVYAYYWSQTETDSTRSKYLHLQSATSLINPYRNHYKSVGMTLRCVK